MNNIKKSTVLTTISIAVLLTATTLLLIKTQSNKKDLLKQTSINQNLAETNVKLKKEISILSNDFDRNNERVNDLIKENDKIIAGNNEKIRKLLADNSRGNSAIKRVKEYESENQRLQSEILAIQEHLTMINNQSKEQSGRITNLEHENRQLREQNRLLGNMVTDNIHVYAGKGKKNKLTVAAARTGLITATLDVPASLKRLNYEIINPDGDKIIARETSEGIKISEPFNVTDRTNSGVVELLKSVEIKFQPKSKLKKGVYKLTVYDDDNYLTSVNIALK